MNTIDETIYNLLGRLPKCLSVPTNHPKRYYRSNFAANVIHDLNKNKQSHRTMGVATVSKPDPAHPLRRRQHCIELPKIMPFVRVHRIPPIPTVIKQSTEKSTSPQKNFIEENINKVKNSAPANSRRYVVSDRKGNKFPLDGSGLQNEFIHKKEYGKIPAYLEARKITDNQQCCCPKQENSMKIMSPEERFSLICNLKNRYEETFAQYQRLPLRLETASSIMKKTHLTNELTSLERDIDFLESHQQIFIVENYSDVN